jgi:hypothetical protein
MQIVYLSARPALLAETLGHLAHFAPFIDDVVVVAPERLASEMPSDTTVLTDEAVAGRTTSELAEMPHTSRNYLLRTSVVRHDAVADVFLMSDDDSRPLVPIDESTFVDDGRFRRRWFHTMAAWRRLETEFDESILATGVILRQMGYPNPLSYACHMPQIIDRELYTTVADRFAEFADDYQLEEWSPYFTIAPTLAPKRFADPEPFATLGWPQYPGEWPHQVTPPRFLFENHHPELHEAGGLYDGLATGCDPAGAAATNLEKIIRWHRLDIQVRELAFPDDVDQPWTGTGSARRRLAFKGLRAARGAYRYIALDERARITELEGRLDRLERGEP